MECKMMIYEKRDNVGTITLNRPEVLNAINTKMSEEIIDVYLQVT